jgi:predicted acyltransferase
VKVTPVPAREDLLKAPEADRAMTIQSSSRIVSLDQFRGYTVAGMFLVNFVGSFEVIKATLPLLKHRHDYCSYADTIMPHFLFAVGLAYRMTFLRRQEKVGAPAAYLQALKRGIGLLLLGFVVHHLDGQYQTWSSLRETGLSGVVRTGFQRNFFQTLSHIGVTSIWVMPVIAARPIWRILFAVFSGILFHVLSEYGYYEWVMKRPGIDGGPLGFLTWTIPLVLGTLAYDLISAKRFQVTWMILASILVMLIGYALSCLNLVVEPNHWTPSSQWTAALVEPPFVPPTRPVNIWTMSQRAGSVSYLTFGAGFSLAVYVLFVLACDRMPLQIGVFRTFGTNALAGYILHDLVNEAIKPFMPKDSPLWWVFCGFALSFGLCYLFLRYMERNKLHLRL